MRLIASEERAESGTMAKAAFGEPPPPCLEVDLMDHAKADQRGERKSDADGEQIHVDGQLVAGVRLRGTVGVRGCHESPWCLSFWSG